MAYDSRTARRREQNDKLSPVDPAKEFNLIPGAQQTRMLQEQVGYKPDVGFLPDTRVRQRHALAHPGERTSDVTGMGPARAPTLGSAVVGSAAVGANPNVGLADEQTRAVAENRMNQQAGGEATTEARGTRGTPPLPAGGFAWRDMRTGSSFEAPGGKLKPGVPVESAFGKFTPGKEGTLSETNFLSADEYNAKADALKAARLERQAMRPQRSGAPSGMSDYERGKLLEGYKKELSGILADSRRQKLTARGTQNAISALKDYYGEALGLTPAQEEAGKNYREELGAATDIAQSKITAGAYANRYDQGTYKPDWATEFDPYGNAYIMNKAQPGAVPRPTIIPSVNEMLYQLGEMPEGPEKEAFKAKLRAQNIQI